MSVMAYVLSVLGGLIWGFLAALLNAHIAQNSLKKGDDKALMGSNLVRSVVDILALAAVFVLKMFVDFPYTIALVATAAAMSLATIVFSYRLAGGKRVP